MVTLPPGLADGRRNLAAKLRRERCLPHPDASPEERGNCTAPGADIRHIVNATAIGSMPKLFRYLVERVCE